MFHQRNVSAQTQWLGIYSSRVVSHCSKTRIVAFGFSKQHIFCFINFRSKVVATTSIWMVCYHYPPMCFSYFIHCSAFPVEIQIITRIRHMQEEVHYSELHMVFAECIHLKCVFVCVWEREAILFQNLKPTQLWSPVLDWGSYKGGYWSGWRRYRARMKKDFILVLKN